MTMIIDGTNGQTFPDGTTVASFYNRFRGLILLSGTTYTVPSDVKELYVFVYGSTGGVSAASRGAVGGAGYSETYYATPAASYSYAIGAGGANTGTAGGTTTFGAMSVTGSGGVTTTTGSLGGVGSGGTFNATGGTGGTFSTNWGGAGGAASRAGNGGNGGNGGTAVGGGGGTGGNAGTSSPTVTAQGAAATVKAAGALTLPWLQNATEYFDGSSASPGADGAAAFSLSNKIVVFTISKYLSRIPATLYGIGSESTPAFGNNSAVGKPGQLHIVEVLK